MLPTGPATKPLALWLEPGPEVVEVVAGDGRLVDKLSVTLRKKEKKIVIPIINKSTSSVMCFTQLESIIPKTLMQQRKKMTYLDVAGLCAA